MRFSVGRAARIPANDDDKGEYFPMFYSDEAVEKAVEHRIVLSPKWVKQWSLRALLLP